MEKLKNAITSVTNGEVLYLDEKDIGCKEKIKNNIILRLLSIKINGGVEI